MERDPRVDLAIAMTAGPVRMNPAPGGVLRLAASIASRPARAVGGGVLLVAFLCVGAVGARDPDAVTRLETDERRVPSSASSETEPSVPVPATKAKERFATPEAIEDADTGEKLAALAEEFPEDPAVHKRAALLLSTQGDGAGAVRAVRKVARLSADAMGDQGLQQVLLRAAAGAPEAADLAFDLLTSESLGAVGPDLLWTLATGPGTTRAVRERAAEALSTEHVRGAATPALTVAIELQALKNPCERRKLFARARDEGDARALEFLSPLMATSGCGFMNTGDCLKCLGNRADLREAIVAIQDRAKAAGRN